MSKTWTSELLDLLEADEKDGDGQPIDIEMADKLSHLLAIVDNWTVDGFDRNGKTVYNGLVEWSEDGGECQSDATDSSPARALLAAYPHPL